MSSAVKIKISLFVVTTLLNQKITLPLCMSFFLHNSAVSSFTIQPFDHKLPSTGLVSSTSHTGQDRLKTPAHHQPVSAYH